MAVLKVSRPMRRAGSRFIWFRQRIPQDMLRHPRVKAGGLELAIPVGDATVIKRLSPKAIDVELSLRTTHAAEGNRRQGEVASYLENVWSALRRDQPVGLTHRQCTALAADLYHAWTTRWATGPVKGWAKGVTYNRDDEGRLRPEFLYATTEEEHATFTQAMSRYAAAPDDRLEALLGEKVDRLLLAKGIAEVDAETRPTLLKCFLQAIRQAVGVRQREADGDYSPDPMASRFPEWVAPASSSSLSPSSLALPALLDLWWTEARALGRKEGTYQNYAHGVRAFCRHLAAVGKSDAAAGVTPADVVAFKAWRLATISSQTGRPLSPGGIRGNELGGLRTIFAFGVRDKLLPTNPVLGVTFPRITAAPRSRTKSFTDAEAIALLRQATNTKRKVRERACTTAARRWLPWLLAYTGARVGEMGQLRKEHVRQEGLHWVLTITPEGSGTVKDNKVRKVPLHPHLIEQGFVEFLKAAPPGHLFIKVGPDGRACGPLHVLKMNLAPGARVVLGDEAVAPSHGWRHHWKSTAIRLAIDPRVRDAIQGHSPRTAGEGYGEVGMEAMAEAVAKFPRYEVT
jgi:integrase